MDEEEQKALDAQINAAILAAINGGGSGASDFDPRAAGLVPWGENPNGLAADMYGPPAPGQGWVSQGTSMIWKDPVTGALYNRNGTPLSQWMTEALYGGGGGGGGTGGGGDGVSWANLGQRQAEFEYQKQQDAQTQQRQAQRDRVGDALNTLNAIASQQAREDDRRSAAQAAFLKAVGVAAAPGQKYQYGFEPDSFAVRAGLTGAIPITPVAFDPTSVMRGNPYDADFQRALGVYQGAAA